MVLLHPPEGSSVVIFMLVSVSLLLSLYELSCGGCHEAYPLMFMIAMIAMLAVRRYRGLIDSDYYGVGQEMWEDSSRRERSVYRRAYAAACVREEIEQMIATREGNKAHLKWALYRLDNLFG